MGAGGARLSGRVPADWDGDGHPRTGSTMHGGARREGSRSQVNVEERLDFLEGAHASLRA